MRTIRVKYFLLLLARSVMLATEHSKHCPSYLTESSADLAKIPKSAPSPTFRKQFPFFFSP